MKLSGFYYLRRRRILTLAVILIMASTLFTITIFSLLGLYKGFNAYLGESEEIIAIYDRNSRTPFTGGYVPTYLAEKIGLMNGVLASSPEVIAPCFLKDEATFLRGIIPEDFTKLNQLTMLDGSMIELSDLDSTIVGSKLAKRLGLKAGDRVLVFGIFRSRYIELEIKGIFTSQSAMDDEALAPLYVGQWLRVDYNHVTLIRFKIDQSVINQAMIFEEVSKEASESGQSEIDGQWSPGPSITQIIPITETGFKIEAVGVDRAKNFMKSYLDAYGVTRETLLILCLMVFSLASASVISASRILINQHKGEIEVLKSVGASNKIIKIDLIVKALPWSLLSSLIGTFIGILVLMVIERSGYVRVLSHGINFYFDPLVLALQLIFTSLIVAVSILLSFKSQF